MIFNSNPSSPAPLPENPADIAILGSSPLAAWLAVRFAHAGHRPLLVTTPAEVPAFQNAEFSLKEDRAVKRRCFPGRVLFEKRTNLVFSFIAGKRAGAIH